MENSTELLELDRKASSIFSDFMTRVTKFEELVSIGSRSLVGLHQHLQLLRRRPLNETSEVVKSVIKANQTKRLDAYVKSGWMNVTEGVQSVSKLNECQKALEEHTIKGKELLCEIECLINDILEVLQNLSESTFKFGANHLGDDFVVQPAHLEKDEMECVHPSRPSISDYATMMGSIYLMLKQDYSMQEKIVSAADLYPSSEELESYSIMWNLRPYVNDEVVHEAWRFIK